MSCPTSRKWFYFKLGALNIVGLELSKNFSEKCFIFRNEAADVWDALDRFASDDESEQNGLDILGSSGVGKSCEVWAWINCQYAELKPKFFALWEHIYLTLHQRV